MNLFDVLVRPVSAPEEPRFQKLMQEHHYLGALPKISETLWYVATLADQWLALLSFSAAALKCSARDRWIGWDFRHRYDRLKLLANNSRFLTLPVAASDELKRTNEIKTAIPLLTPSKPIKSVYLKTSSSSSTTANSPLLSMPSAVSMDASKSAKSGPPPH